jgi:sugar/nucleoside kinase (ribokinase family)
LKQLKKLLKSYINSKLKIMKFDVLSLGPARMDCFVMLPDEEVVEVCSVDQKNCMIQLGFGEKIAVKSMSFAIGGNAGNNAVGVTRLGLKAALVGSVGDRWTDRQAIEILKQEGVETKYVEIKEGQSGFGVIINYQGERTILSYYSHSVCCFPTDPELAADWIYLTSMGEGYEEFYKEAVGWAKSHGAKIAFNPGTRQLKAGLEHLSYAYEAAEILFVNKEEALEILNSKPEILSSKQFLNPNIEIKDLLGKLRDLSSRVVVITDGGEGSYAYDGEKYIHMPIAEAPVVERTGAGDAFGSGFLAAYIQGKPVSEALRWGTVNGASVLGFVGPQSGLLTPDKIREWLVKIQNLQPEELV